MAQRTLRAMRKAMKQTGVELGRSHRHEVWVCPDGHVVAVLPVSPSDGEQRIFLNQVRDMRRLYREQGCVYVLPLLEALSERKGDA